MYPEEIFKDNISNWKSKGFGCNLNGKVEKESRKQNKLNGNSGCLRVYEKHVNRNLSFFCTHTFKERWLKLWQKRKFSLICCYFLENWGHIRQCPPPVTCICWIMSILISIKMSWSNELRRWRKVFIAGNNFRIRNASTNQRRITVSSKCQYFTKQCIHFIYCFISEKSLTFFHKWRQVD